MAEKRRDRKGRVLKEGETQRKDGTYMYRYQNLKKERKCVYAKSLEELREKEKKITKEINDGIDYAAGSITVIQLVERYCATKTGVRQNTRDGYQFVTNLIKKEDFGYKSIRDVKPSDAKAFCIRLNQEGKSYSTISSVCGVLRPAFKMAAEDDIIRRNPFSFKLASIVRNDSKVRQALNQKDQERYLEYVRNSKYYSKYYDEIIILLQTGMRVSELYGLTKNDVDFKLSRIAVNKQLVRNKHCEYYIEEPKTTSGKRYIPMTQEAGQAFRRVLKNRKNPNVEKMIDGYSGFLFLDREDKPKVAMHLEHAMKRMLDRFNATSKEKVPPITPHVLRHTFCTNMASRGMEVKSLQYLMGHSDVGVTLNVYTHVGYEKAQASMMQVVGEAN